MKVAKSLANNALVLPVGGSKHAIDCDFFFFHGKIRELEADLLYFIM